MKIRSGYISNSSSSSFLIIGNEVGDIFDEPKKEINFKKDYYVFVGKNDFDSGTDLVELNQEKYDWLYEHRWNIKDIGAGTIIKVIELQENDCIKIPNNVKNAKVWNINVNHHSSETIEDLERKYL